MIPTKKEIKHIMHLNNIFKSRCGLKKDPIILLRGDLTLREYLFHQKHPLKGQDYRFCKVCLASVKRSEKR